MEIVRTETGFYGVEFCQKGELMPRKKADEIGRSEGRNYIFDDKTSYMLFRLAELDSISESQELAKLVQEAYEKLPEK